MKKESCLKFVRVTAEYPFIGLSASQKRIVSLSFEGRELIDSSDFTDEQWMTEFHKKLIAMNHSFACLHPKEDFRNYEIYRRFE